MTWAPELSLAEIADGGRFSDGDWVESKDQDPHGDVRLTQLADVGTAIFRDRSDRWLREDQAARLGCTFLEPNDILVARMPDPIGRACLVPNNVGRAVTVVDVAILRLRRGDIDPRYAMWAINSPSFHRSVVRLQSGTTRKRISRKNLATLRIPVPSIDEQRRIVTILEDHLSRLDVADANLARAQRRLMAFDRACLETNFGARGSTVGLGELLTDIRAGKSFGGATAPAREGEWGIIKVSAMTWGEFRSAENKAVVADRVDERYEIREGDLLVSRANTSEYVGASVLVGEVRPKLLLSDKSLRLTPKEGVDPRWLWRALQAPSARRQISALATGTKDSMRNISQSSLRMVNVPKLTRDDQVAALESYESLTRSALAARTALAAQSRRSQGLRRALLTAAFSGKLTREIG